jgi:NADH-quinone oxidoreductase subunit N
MVPPLAIAPLVAVTVGALVVLLAEAFLRKKDSEVPAALAVASLIAAGFFAIVTWGEPGLGAFGGRLILDPLARLMIVIFVVLGTFVVLMSLRYAARQGLALGPLCGLLLLAVAGLMIMVSTRDWLIVFLGLEVLSVASYALTGLRLHDKASSEAAAKYFLMGSFAAAFFVFGLAFVFGTSGRLDLGAGVTGLTALAGLGLILSALFFKIAVAPFHMWAPDVYEGAPTPVTVFLTIAPKAAVLAALLRALSPLIGAEGAAAVLAPALSVAAVLTMFAGNLAALRQTSLKRILAYSSIAHSGYLLVAVVARDAASLVFYVSVYLFMNAGAFGVLVALSGMGLDRASLDDIAGLGRRKPWLAAALTVFLLSLAGFPPTAGFLAKFYVFSAAVREGHIALTLAAVVASLVSVAYYLKVIVAMYMREEEAESEPWPEDPALYLVVFLCLFGVVELGLWPGNLLTFIRQAFPGPF